MNRQTKSLTVVMVLAMMSPAWAGQGGAVVDLPTDYPTFDPRPCRRPANRMSMCLNGRDWRVAQVEVGRSVAASMLRRKGTPCTVPGSVPSALLEGRGRVPLTGGKVPVPDYFGTNTLSLTTATVCETWFSKTFRVPEAWKEKLVRLRFGAVDYDATFYLNGKRLGRNVGHFAPVTLDASKAMRFDADNVLSVQIAPFITDRCTSARSQILKNMQSDCTPAACPLGISDDVFVLASDTLYIDNLCVRSTLADDFARATVEVRMTTASRADVDARIVYTVRSIEEPEQSFTATQKVRIAKGVSTVAHSVEVVAPRLWWPNGAGEQNRYEARVTVRAADDRELDVCSTTFGIRKLEMVPNEGAEEVRFPWTFVVNGKKIYAKGANWAPADCFYRTDAAMYERLILHAKSAHFNMLRWWGGGVPERDAFYDLCDRHGIMLFHDFFLANGLYDAPAFLKLLETQSRGFVRRLRNHPSIVLWTGGNEFAECAATRLLDRVAAEEDPTRPYRPPSPTVGEHHGPYRYRPESHYAQCNKNVWPHFAQVRSEFACCCAANADTLRKIIPADELASVARGDFSSVAWEHHNAHVWMDHDATQRFFGPIADLDRYCVASQFARAEGLRYAIEAMRRKKFRASATLYWQYNESWPNAAGNATVDWFAQPRITHDYARKAHEPVHASLEYETVYWTPGKPFEAKLWATSDRFEDLPGCEIAWSVYDVAGQRVAGQTRKTTLAANRSAEIGDVRWNIPRGYDSFFVVYCTIRDTNGGKTLSANEYVHFARPADAQPWSVLLHAPPTQLELSVRPIEKNTARAVVRNSGKRNAVLCRLSLPLPSGAIALFDDNAFFLPPGGNREIGARVLNPSRPDWGPDFATLSLTTFAAE